MALVMNQTFRGRNLNAAFLLLPFIVPNRALHGGVDVDPSIPPSASSTGSWCTAGSSAGGYSWLGNATLAMCR